MTQPLHAVITGANRGIGAAMNADLQAAGWHVTGTSRRTGDGLADLDVTDPNSHAAFAAALDGRAVDLLICNAGVYVDKGQNLAEGYPAQMWADSFAVNVTGVFLTVQSLLPNLQAADAAKVAIISSQMGSHARAKGNSFVYRASKAAAINLSANLATALKGLNISVGTYHPGWVTTDMGGPQADIDAKASAAGLVQEFERLSLETTGCFRTWDGRDHPL